MNVEFDLKEILVEFKQGLDKLEKKIDKLDGKIDKVSEDVNQLKVDMTRSEAEIKGEIKILGEKIEGLNKRIDTQEFINRGVIVGLVLAVLGGFAKLFGIVS